MNNIEIEERVQRGVQLHKQGYNCAQSVVLALHDLVGWDEHEAMQLSAPFGRGLAGMMELCGCVSAMALLASRLIPQRSLDDMAAKKAQFQLVQQFTAAFRELNGDVVCRRLMGVEGAAGIVKKSCTDKVADAVRIVATYMCEM